MRILVTGSCGLIGGEAVEYFGSRGHDIVGIDNNMRREFFGPAGDTLWNLHRVAHKVPNYKHHEMDIRDAEGGTNIVGKGTALSTYVFQGAPFDAVIHCAAQPSHDKAKENPQLDYDVNVVGTRNMLEATRKHSPNAVFIFMSTNKIYGNSPNWCTFVEKDTRYDYDVHAAANQPQGCDPAHGVNENLPIDRADQELVFGLHKLEADDLVREYALLYGMRTVVLRGGCLTGPGHSGVEMHGFLSYLVKCVITGKTYKIFGYKGKQVRDNIHSHDVMRAIEMIIANPHPGEAYNIGGGRQNSTSILEAIDFVKELTGLKVRTEYVDAPRVGDHKCYISDMRKFQEHYPQWSITKGLADTLFEMLQQYYWGTSSDDVYTREYPLDDNSLVVDVGGYRGAFAYDIVRRYNPWVHIFEPVEDFFRPCQHRFKDNPKVAVSNVGLSDSNELVPVFKQAYSTSEFLTDKNLEAEVVQLRDAYEALKGWDSIDLLSLNCEGGEFKILHRLISTGLITRCKNVQIQFHRFYPDAEKNRDEIRELLSKTHRENFCYAWLWESWSWIK